MTTTTTAPTTATRTATAAVPAPDSNPPSATHGYEPGSLMTLTGVRWETYESLLSDLAESSSPRVTYDRGTLEIMSPTLIHEGDHRSLGDIVLTVAVEWEIDVRDVGSVTVRRADLQRGFEADTSFYVQHAAVMRGKVRLDLDVDPPPDLLIEMEVTTSAIAKLPLFAAMGIPEVWRVTPERVAIFTLREGAYDPTPTSIAFPPLTSEVLTRFLMEGRTMPSTRWIRGIRAWAMDHPHPGDQADGDEGAADGASDSPGA